MRKLASNHGTSGLTPGLALSVLFATALLINGIRLIAQRTGLPVAVVQMLFGALTLVAAGLLGECQRTRGRGPSRRATTPRAMIAEDERRTVVQSLIWLCVGIAVLVQGLTTGGFIRIVGLLTFLASTYLGLGMLWVTYLARRRRARG